MSSSSAAKIDAETSSPNDSIASTYPYVFRRVYHCGHPDELIEVSQLDSPKRIMYVPIALEDDSRPGGGRQSYSLERCRNCAELHFGADKRLSEHDEMTNRPRSMAAYQGAALRRRDSGSSVQDGFARVLKRLQEARRARRTSVSHEHGVGHAASAGAPDGTLDVKALRVATKLPGLFGNGRQPRNPGAEMDPVLQLYAATTKDHDANIASDGPKPEVVQASGGCGDVSDRRTCETNIAKRHCAAFPDDQNKPRSTYAQANDRFYHSDVDKRLPKLNTADSQSKTMQQLSAEHLEAMVDTNPYAAHERNRSERNDVLVMMHLNDTTMSNSGAMTRWYESTPELDSGSESDRSPSEELEVPILSPDAFGIPSMELNGWLGGILGVNDPGFRDVADRDAVAFASGAYRSRFSWGSSIYSDAGLEPGSEGAVWWKPRPLVVKKDVPPSPPPIPERNPLRLLNRTTQAPPTSLVRESRASRNILNLHLDLSHSTTSKKRESAESTSTKRKRSQTSRRKSSKSTHKETLSTNGTSDHIVEVARLPGKEAIKHRRSVSSAWSKGPKRSHSHSDLSRTSEYAERVKGARGHTRGTSEPFRTGSGCVRRSSSSKWDAAMPSQGTVRRSCIPSLVNEHKVPRPATRLAINKELPPLPVASQSP